MWSFAATSSSEGASAKATLVQVASSFGLEMLPLRIDLNRLKQFRVACLVETVSSPALEPTLLIMRGVSADGVELTDASGVIRRLGDEEFARGGLGRRICFTDEGLNYDRSSRVASKLRRCGYCSGGSANSDTW